MYICPPRKPFTSFPIHLFHSFVPPTGHGGIRCSEGRAGPLAATHRWAQFESVSQLLAQFCGCHCTTHPRKSSPQQVESFQKNQSALQQSAIHSCSSSALSARCSKHLARRRGKLHCGDHVTHDVHGASTTTRMPCMVWISAGTLPGCSKCASYD